MTRTITIGEKPVMMTATASTSYRFKQIFHADLLKNIALLQNADDDTRGAEMADTLTKLAYVMQAQAGNADMAKLNEDTFMTWLDEYAPMDFINQETMNAVLGLFNGDEPDVEAKKNEPVPPGN